MKSPFASSARNRCTANRNAYPLTLLTDGHDDDATAFNSKTFVGGKGADRIEAGSDAYILLGEQGNDVLIGRDGSDFPAVVPQRSHVRFGSEADFARTH